MKTYTKKETPMKKMKLILIATLTIMAAAAPVICLAQDNGGNSFKEMMKNTTPEERADAQTEMMEETLGLDSEQKEKVHAVNLKYARKTGEVFSSQTPRFRKFRKLKAISSDKDKALKAVFTDQQFETYQKSKEEMKAKLKEKRQ